MENKTWKKFFYLLCLNILFSVLIACFFWSILLGRYFNIDVSSNIDIDFLNILLGSFTIIGFAISIYQIAKLRTETEIEIDIMHEWERKTFIRESVPVFNNIRKNVKELLHKIVNATLITDSEIKKYISDISSIIELINDRKSHQEISVKLHIVDCESCINLLNELLNECDVINSKQTYQLFRPLFFRQKLTDLLKMISDCENNLKSN